MFLALGRRRCCSGRTGSPDPADAAIAACLLLVASHAAFKTTLFLGAGSVLHATGERDLDRLGGLGARMPVTSAAFGVGALGAAALPVTAGFVAEWALLQSLIHGASAQDRLVAVVMPVSVAVVALTAGLALLTFVKAYGIAFLARPRAARVRPRRTRAGRSMRAAMCVAAVDRARARPRARVRWPRRRRPRPRVCPGWGRSAGGASTCPGSARCWTRWRSRHRCCSWPCRCVLVSVAAARRRPRRRVEPDLGLRRRPAEPADAVHRDVLRRAADPGLRRRAATRARRRGHPPSESRYLVERVQFRQRRRRRRRGTCLPARLRLVDRRRACCARHLQNGSIHRYLGYSFVALLAVLVVVACERRRRGPGGRSRWLVDGRPVAAAGRAACARCAPGWRAASAPVSCSRGETCASCWPRSRCRPDGTSWVLVARVPWCWWRPASGLRPGPAGRDGHRSAGPGRPVRGGLGAAARHGGAGAGRPGRRHGVRRDGLQPAHDDRGAGRADGPGVGLRAVDPGRLLGAVA